MNNQFLIWMLFGVFLLLIEIGHPGLFYFLSLSLGAFAAAITALNAPALLYQAVVFLGVTSFSLLVLTKLIKHHYLARRTPYQSNMYALIGKRGTVIEEIGELKPGYIRVNSELWLARDVHQKKVPVGEVVEVINVVGSHLVVKKNL